MQNDIYNGYEVEVAAFQYSKYKEKKPSYRGIVKTMVQTQQSVAFVLEEESGRIHVASVSRCKIIRRKDKNDKYIGKKVIMGYHDGTEKIGTVESCDILFKVQLERDEWDKSGIPCYFNWPLTQVRFLEEEGKSKFNLLDLED
jgi:hypothetical protein